MASFIVTIEEVTEPSVEWVAQVMLGQQYSERTKVFRDTLEICIRKWCTGATKHTSQYLNRLLDGRSLIYKHGNIIQPFVGIVLHAIPNQPEFEWFSNVMTWEYNFSFHTDDEKINAVIDFATALFQIANQIPGHGGQNVMLAVVLFFLEVVVPNGRPNARPTKGSLIKIFALFEEEMPKTDKKGKEGSWDLIVHSLQAIVFRFTGDRLFDYTVQVFCAKRQASESPPHANNGDVTPYLFESAWKNLLPELEWSAFPLDSAEEDVSPENRLETMIPGYQPEEGKDLRTDVGRGLNVTQDRFYNFIQHLKPGTTRFHHDDVVAENPETDIEKARSGQYDCLANYEIERIISRTPTVLVLGAIRKPPEGKSRFRVVLKIVSVYWDVAKTYTNAEVQIGTEKSHPGMVRMESYFGVTPVHPGRLAIAMVMEPGIGDLDEELPRFYRMPSDERLVVVIRLIHQIVAVVFDLHTGRYGKPKIHRDIKPQNIILFRRDLLVKLGDNGVARDFEEGIDLTVFAGTKDFVSAGVGPEGFGQDVLALAVTFFLCLCKGKLTAEDLKNLPKEAIEERVSTELTGVEEDVISSITLILHSMSLPSLGERWDITEVRDAFNGLARRLQIEVNEEDEFEDRRPNEERPQDNGQQYIDGGNHNPSDDHPNSPRDNGVFCDPQDLRAPELNEEEENKSGVNGPPDVDDPNLLDDSKNPPDYIAPNLESEDYAANRLGAKTPVVSNLRQNRPDLQGGIARRLCQDEKENENSNAKEDVSSGTTVDTTGRGAEIGVNQTQGHRPNEEAPQDNHNSLNDDSSGVRDDDEEFHDAQDGTGVATKEGNRPAHFFSRRLLYILLAMLLLVLMTVCWVNQKSLENIISFSSPPPEQSKEWSLPTSLQAQDTANDDTDSSTNHDVDGSAHDENGETTTMLEKTVEEFSDGVLEYLLNMSKGLSQKLSFPPWTSDDKGDESVAKEDDSASGMPRAQDATNTQVQDHPKGLKGIWNRFRHRFRPSQDDQEDRDLLAGLSEPSSSGSWKEWREWINDSLE